MTHEGIRIDLSKESFGKAVPVADGVWVIATRHRPGGSRSFPEINNRAVVFRLEEGGNRVLVVMNGVEPAAIPEVKQIESRSGLTVKYVVSPGGGHHFLMPPWQAAFPEAKILLPPTRIPRTAGGKKLLALPRVELLDADDPLPMFKGQLDAVLFRGLYGLADRPAPAEGGPDGLLTMVGMMMRMMFSMKDPIDELWIHHVPTGTVIGGENLGWMYPEEVLKTQPGMLRSMVKPGKVYIFDGPRKVADRAMIVSCWKKILEWPARTVMTYHDVLGYSFQGDGQTALCEAVKSVKQLS